MSGYGPLYRSELHPGEDEYFSMNPEVAGMAAEDNRVILNPYSTLSSGEKSAVYLNEASRIHMRNYGTPQFDMTNQQHQFLDGNAYKGAPDDDRRQTVLARIISGDPSAQDYTDEQYSHAMKIKEAMDKVEYSQAFKEQTK